MSFFHHGHKFHDEVCVHCKCAKNSPEASVKCPGEQAQQMAVEDDFPTPITSPILDPLSMVETAAVDAAGDDSPAPADDSGMFAGGESGSGGGGASWTPPEPSAAVAETAAVEVASEPMSVDTPMDMGSSPDLSPATTDAL